MRRRRPQGDRMALLREVAGVLALAGYSHGLGAEGGENRAWVRLGEIAGELGVPGPPALRTGEVAWPALDRWAVEIGAYHLPGECRGHPDGHWVVHCRRV